ncbi:DoxX family protein [Corynebacterium afermentans]|uniref:DoxX family protein n=1 Tax=Corynebacterium afermentans TaxID=38286 RepID=UPI002572B409|nr:DoxX family protein [Corynebacterium afermentans]MCG7291952.1 DoxX family protein [Corynebacterium afermentans]
MIRKIARPMLASVYVIDGVETLLNPAGHKDSADSVLKKLRDLTPREYRGFLPKSPETAAQIIGATKAGAGASFAIGKFPRLSATLLAATALPTVMGRHAFWEAEDDDEKARLRTGALTDLGLAGGVLLATVDNNGKPDLKWRAQHAAEAAQKNVKQALPTKSETEKAWDKASDWFSDATDQVTDYVDDNKGDWKKKASKAGDAANDWLGDAKKQASSFLSDAGDWLDDAAEKATDKAEDAYGDIKPSKIQQFKAKRKVNSVVGDLQDQLDDLQPSALDKFKAKRKVNKASAKAQDKAQNAVDALQNAWDKLDANPSWITKLKWKRKAKKAEKKAQKLVKKAQKKFA